MSGNLDGAATDPTTSIDLGSEVALTAFEPGGWPVVVEARADRLRRDEIFARTWFQERKAAFDRALAEVGALVLRGFALSDAASFSRFIRHYPEMPKGYAGGGAQRSEVADRVWDTVQSRASTSRIGLHQEMSYLPDYPTQIAFFCHVPATTGGETVIGDIRRLEDRMPDRLLSGVEEKGIRYVRSMRATDRRVDAPPEHQDYLHFYYRPWPEVYGTSERAEVERQVLEAGQEFEWLPDGGLATHYSSPGFAVHPVTGRSSWFNSTSLYHGNHVAADLPRDVYRNAFPEGTPKPFDVIFGDGSPIPEDDAIEVNRILEEITVAHAWQAGDVMLVDNLLTAHGGNAWAGPRDVLVSMFG